MTDIGPAGAALAAIEKAPSVVTIGNFDGVHRGHQQLVAMTVAEARRLHARSVVVTFDPHPVSVLRPDVAPPRLTDLVTRQRLLEQAGVDLVVVLPFTAELARLAPEVFVATVLNEGLDAQHVVVGDNFRFGRGARGDVETLRADGGFEVTAVGLHHVGSMVVSTSAVRASLERGDVAAAAEALGRPHFVSGTVGHGDGRGRTIGVPTANIAVAGDLVVPGRGVYAGWVTVGHQWQPCVTNVGVRPTVADDLVEPRIETHVLDTADDLDLYGQQVAVTFIDRLRDEQRFDDFDQLVAQIRHDITAARAITAEQGCPTTIPVPHW